MVVGAARPVNGPTLSHLTRRQTWKETPMPEEPLSNEELLKIAAEVMEGKRPQSDLEKYGLSLGEEIEGERAKDMLMSELSALGAWDEDDEEEPPTPDATAG
jgi:hypothetical protein